MVPISWTDIVYTQIKHRKEAKKEYFDSTDPAYQETLKTMRQTISYTAVNTVEDLQHVTTGWVPHPPSVLVKDVVIPTSFYPEAARIISDNLGEKNLNRVGKTWWQWRKPGSVVRAEWIEMKSDYLERVGNGGNGVEGMRESKKVIFYIHGGAYFFGGIGHIPQMQRHARKLKGRVFAPRYRLAPQFPFPCAVQDVLSAYLYLLTIQDPSTIVVAGDSAGGGLCLSLLIILRDAGLPLPAGASLISPWVDLTHSFPSITIPTGLDYVPSHGFHAKPSLSWPPPNSDEIEAWNLPVHKNIDPDFEVEIDGEMIALKEQFQMYAPNNWLQIPLVSGIVAASLGGLCPLQVIVGGGEVLRDEQIYIAHKAASPTSYPPCPEILERNGNTWDDVTKYPPTDVQLLVFDDCPHAAPTVLHTKGAMFEYRAVSQFAAWALAKAQGVEMVDYGNGRVGNEAFIGKAGDPLPPFRDHMIRLHVGNYGELYPIKPASDLRACNINNSLIGFPKEEALKIWFEYREKWDVKYRAEKEKRFGTNITKVWKQRVKDTAVGYARLPNEEVPPATALAGRLVIGREVESEKERGKIGKGIFGGLFGKLYQEGPQKVEANTLRGNAPRYSSLE
ncbi:related to acetyl-hydrolase [Phialocephala subalpina]|uniref:Related to acetyl-hydrolase n=1 Tax=Phialocephala subalpina TaxID=576137 RepID=A0A1L7XM09_9HELO|nr:related to acetyl-hydrolase [Phialocephala subalpina]